MMNFAGRRNSGFTLIELMAAMAILSALGALLVQLVRGSFDMYRQGDLRGDLYANAMPILEMLEDDLSATYGGPEGRFLLRTEILGGGRGTGDGFLLRIVRTIPGGERGHGVLRRAGTAAGASGVFVGDDPGVDKRKDVAPPTGLMEVAYALIQEPTDPPGVLALYRGERAPALAQGGFFDPALEDAIDESWVRQNLKPTSAGILGLWLICQGQGADAWDEEAALNAMRPCDGAYVQWDSTRAILSSSSFPLAVGEESLSQHRDDVFPKRVRLVLEVCRVGRPEATLRRRLTSEQTSIEVNTAASFPTDDDPDRAIKVGSEWMEVAEGGVSGSTVRVARNRRRTQGLTLDHAPGDPVFVGRAFRLTMSLPAARSYWGEERR